MQLATRITPLKLDADGVHRLTVNLHPVDLGPVQVVAEIRNGEINLQLSSSTDAGHDSLRDSLDQLRRELEQSGFSNTNLDLRQGSQQDQARQQFAFMNNGDTNGGSGRTGNGSGNTPDTAAETATPAPSRTSSNSLLDVEA